MYALLLGGPRVVLSKVLRRVTRVITDIGGFAVPITTAPEAPGNIKPSLLESFFTQRLHDPLN